MADKNDTITSRMALQSLLVQQTLKSWRFFLLFSVPPMVWVIFVAPPVLPRVFITLLCGIVWFGCWRLWLDAHYFKFMSDENNELAGEVLFVIWRRERLQKLTFVERQSGALKQYRRTMWLTGALWAAWLMALL
ncbi:membrane protein [Chania multitudinisentens RB-25]|uniref:Membrane protein n=1 Tax=Chania multitudinisentens RB-25 TaxID=1441930 RepID=W0L8Y1_9GAMM|nr:hypothetical protein [Chania multitudinisentens]AHG20278.1 membrane protein [Chania multitudinisentens RB-25]